MKSYRMRYHDWNGEHKVPVGASEIAYDRRGFDWVNLEPFPHVYDFTSILSALAAAKQKGQTFAFRVRCMHDTSPNQGNFCPNWIPGTTVSGTFFPDWNSANFIEGTCDLLRRLGQVVGNTELAWVDIGMVGSFGEWADLGTATDDTLVEIVDFYREFFPMDQLCIKANTRTSIVQAALHDYRMGWRLDSLGDLSLNIDPTIIPLLPSRFSAAEFMSARRYIEKGLSYVTALEQIKQLNIKTVGNGNIVEWKSLPVEQQQALIEIGYAEY